MSNNLPDYEYHPLDETVMGMQFAPLQQFGIQAAFRYWSRIHANYPRIEEQPPIAHRIEMPALAPKQEQMKVLLSGAPTPMSRYWFMNASGNLLIQLQRDRFLRNWRLQDGTEKYPRFSTLFPAFMNEWSDFQTFLSEEKIEEPKVNQCELTYVNFIDVNEIEGGLSGIGHVLSFFDKNKPSGFLPKPEAVKWESTFPFPAGRGRLNVSASPNFRHRDFKLVINFTLSARGKPADTSIVQLKSWFEMAHEWIVRGFDELTTVEMHNTWKKK